jgi:tRNA pseudouridine38-40 synthase
MQRWKLTLEYDGTQYAGWQRQGDQPHTVQQRVEEALTAFCQQAIPIQAAGRTDAGVHAAGQVVHFDLDYGARPLSAHTLLCALNAHLRPQPVAVIAAERVAADFHARFMAVNKLYRYRIITRPAPPVLDSQTAWHYFKPLDTPAMQRGARHLLGSHDFSTFRARECQAEHPIRTLDRLDITASPYDPYGAQDIVVEVEAKSFLHHQVRNIVGTLALVGAGKWTPDDVTTALAARDRARGGPTAPACGLTLVRVDY